MPLTSHRDAILEKINLLALFTVEKGKMRCLFYKNEDLRPGQDLLVNGYISGVAVFSNDEVEADLGGMPMSKIRENEDGTLTCKYFGPLTSMESIFPYLGSGTQGQLTEDVKTGTRTPKYLFGGYSYFPKIMGAGVSPEDRFFISLKKREASLKIFIRQQAFRMVYKFQPGTREEVTFEYQGTSLAELFPEEAKLRERLIAVSEGIRAVESRFDMDLVTRVRLVEYEKIHNALACEGEKEIWFYIEALRKEPLEELKTMAEHETLHLLVDRQGFADDIDLRAHFADLKGYGIFSWERFMLITEGIVGAAEQSGNENEIFFAFISERNFLEGIKGGHAHQNLHEFCASFLHSLMFVEQLTKNLDRALALRSHREPYLLTQKERQNVLRDYIKTLDILACSASAERGSFDFLEKICGMLRTGSFPGKTGVNKA